jgi:hypothetical protein
MAAKYGNAVNASAGAQRAVQDAYGSDLLGAHRVMKRNVGIIDDADLILVMEESLLKGLPAEKTHLISEFFGKTGGIENPWPSHTPGAAERYKRCLGQLQGLIEPHADAILAALDGRS